jgi:hypothetical protein
VRAAAVALLLCGCQATVHPRPARVAAAGELAWDVHLPVTRLGPASVDGTLNGSERAVSAIATGVWDGTAVWVPPVWFDGAVAVGVGAGCALGGLLSPFRVGLEARCQVVDGGLDVALAAAGAWLPFFDRDGPWVRAGADLSVEGETVTWMAGLHGAYGPESWWLVPIDTPTGFEDPVDRNTADGGRLRPARHPHRGRRRGPSRPRLGARRRPRAPADPGPGGASPAVGRRRPLRRLRGLPRLHRHRRRRGHQRRADRRAGGALRRGGVLALAIGARSR